MTFAEWMASVRHFIGLVQSAWQSSGQPDLELSSWYRSTADNQAVGGLPNSLHLWGLAIDVTGEPEAVRRFEHWSRLAGMGVDDEVSHLHVQLWRQGIGPRPPVV